ncbi:peptidyl-prolyl cis-trans isomerase-like 2 [Spinellus fusiger]|nr:peptidyl-prolyl cis-trans isomerase-like 2 [Spinellus fusiger]
MGKWTDKLYITHSEWSGEVGQHSASSGIQGRTKGGGFKRLPFYCCSLSLQPFEHPVCTPEGVIFDLVHIVPYIKKYGANPVNGEKLSTKHLITLHFHKNDKDEYYCPVTYKVFSTHTAIAAIKTTGNVFAYDTIERLNIKAKHWFDLLTDEPFTRKDIIMIQDPHNLESRNLTDFHYVKNDRKVVNKEEEMKRKDPINNINVKSMGGTAERVYAELKKKDAVEAAPDSTLTKTPTSFHQKKADKAYNAAHFSTGQVSSSFTSTAMERATVNEQALIDEEEYMFKHIKTKAFARIATNFGNLNIELYCDKAPRTCYNFVKLAKSDYYKDVIFHRSIRNFMIQGGDPTGTGLGGESCWQQEFPDELKFNLSHNDRGILSMANKGKDTNRSQFFITYRPCAQLDGKHAIFGRVVGGLDVLDKIEAVEVDETDRPTRDIKMKEVVVFVDPYEEYQTRLKRKIYRQANADTIEEEERRKKEKEDSMGWFGPNVTKTQQKKTPSLTGTQYSGVGKYLQAAKQEKAEDQQQIPEAAQGLPAPKKLKVASKVYGNFDNF